MEKINSEIIQWIQIDDKIKEYNEKIKELREIKDNKYDSIYEILDIDNTETSNLPKYRIEKLNSFISFNKRTNYNPLTYKYLENCFNSYFDDKEQSDKLLSFIKDNREKETKVSIKRDSIL
jgi:hypothetical protein